MQCYPETFSGEEAERVQVDIDVESFAYPTSGDVLRGFSLSVRSGSIHAIVGPSGCGKSTVLRLVAGLEKAASGAVTFKGQRRHPHLTSIVFETPRLVPWWDVGRNIAVGAEFSATPRGVYEHIKDLYSAIVGLGGLRRRMPVTLSRGQRSRAGLGRALAYDADVLLMDEPFAGLDAPSRRRILAEVETMWIGAPRTMILVTHDIDEAVLLADEVTVMRGDPGSVLDTITVDAPRPRLVARGVSPGVRAAVARAWELMEEPL